jgi:hypothetical protein
MYPHLYTYMCIYTHICKCTYTYVYIYVGLGYRGFMAGVDVGARFREEGRDLDRSVEGGCQHLSSRPLLIRIPFSLKLTEVPLMF